MKIPLSRPDINEDDIDAVVAVLRTSQLSLGPKLSEFEDAFARYIGVAHAVALSSGTAGLHLALLALGIGEGDEVVLPSFTFIAAANAVRHAGARPVFADIDARLLNITAESIEQVITPKTRAILLVHTFGYPAELGPILELARTHDLRVVEDACEAIGAEYGRRKIGSFGDVSVFSFYPNKPITMGEGGIAVTHNTALADTMRALRNQGRSAADGWLEHSVLGYNYRVPDLSCALGLSQLSRVESILARREAVAMHYCDSLEDYPDIVPPVRTIADGRISWFAFVVRLSEQLPPGAREQVIASLAAAGIGCRAYFPPIHQQPLYAGYAGPDQVLNITEGVASRTLALPFFNALTTEHIEEVCSVLGSATQAIRRSM